MEYAVMADQRDGGSFSDNIDIYALAPYIGGGFLVLLLFGMFFTRKR